MLDVNLNLLVLFVDIERSFSIEIVDVDLINHILVSV